MISNQKQLARQRRERKFQRRLTTLSWTLPVFAFGGFFAIWHGVSSAVNPHVQSKSNVSAVANPMKGNSTPSVQPVKTTMPAVLFKEGSKGPQVRVIQEQLHQLGYLDNEITGDYGPVTASAVVLFQLAQHLNATGMIDTDTLTALQQAVRHHKASVLVNSVHSTTHSVVSSPKRHTVTRTPAPTTSRASVSRQSIPQTTSSAS